jgi:hypothetical protein
VGELALSRSNSHRIDLLGSLSFGDFFGGGDSPFAALFARFVPFALSLAFFFRLFGVGFVQSFRRILSIKLLLKLGDLLLEFLDQLLLGSDEIDQSIKAHLAFSDILLELFHIHGEVITDMSKPSSANFTL